MGCLGALIQGLFVLLTGEPVDVDSVDAAASDGGSAPQPASALGGTPPEGGTGEPSFGMSTTVGINPETGNAVVSSTAEKAGGILRDAETGDVLGPNDVSKP